MCSVFWKSQNKFAQNKKASTKPCLLSKGGGPRRVRRGGEFFIFRTAKDIGLCPTDVRFFSYKKTTRFSVKRKMRFFRKAGFFVWIIFFCYAEIQSRGARFKWRTFHQNLAGSVSVPLPSKEGKIRYRIRITIPLHWKSQNKSTQNGEFYDNKNRRLNCTN